jgi:hypothetical protein
MDTLPIVETLKKKFTLHGAELEYRADKFKFAWCGNVKEKLPEVHGVYCLFSHGGTRLQKIGKADGKRGLRGRFRGYTGAQTEEKSEADRTDRLWKTVMNGNLRDQRLSVYYFETPPGVMSIPFVLDGAPAAEPIKYHWARPLEEYLSRLFRREHGEQVGETHMLLLSGTGTRTFEALSENTVVVARGSLNPCSALTYNMLFAIFLGLRSTLWFGLSVADGLGQHLAQLSLGLRRFARRCSLPCGHEQYVGCGRDN